MTRMKKRLPFEHVGIDGWELHTTCSGCGRVDRCVDSRNRKAVRCRPCYEENAPTLSDAAWVTRMSDIFYRRLTPAEAHAAAVEQTRLEAEALRVARAARLAEVNEARRAELEERNLHIYELVSGGDLTVSEAATEFSLGEATIKRILRVAGAGRPKALVTVGSHL